MVLTDYRYGECKRCEHHVDEIATLREQLAAKDTLHYAPDLVEIARLRGEVGRLKAAHCEDCCCSQSWRALGFSCSSKSDIGIVDHIKTLRVRCERLEAALREVLDQEEYQLGRGTLTTINAALSKGGDDD